MLYALAARVLSIPTSSASSERSWSVHSFIHNKRRNRLKPERVEKLAFVYSNAGDKYPNSRVHYLEDDGSTHDCGDYSSESDDETLAVAFEPSAGERTESTPLRSRPSHLHRSSTTTAQDAVRRSPHTLASTSRGQRVPQESSASSQRARRTLFSPASEARASSTLQKDTRRTEFDAPPTPSGITTTPADEFRIRHGLYPKQVESSAIAVDVLPVASRVEITGFQELRHSPHIAHEHDATGAVYDALTSSRLT